MKKYLICCLCGLGAFDKKIGEFCVDEACSGKIVCSEKPSEW